MRLKIALCLILSSVMAAAVHARKVCGETDVAALLGIDAEGNIDEAAEFAAHAKLCINPKSGKLKLVAEAQVENASGENQKYKDPPEDLLDFDPPLQGKKVIYKVKANGAAKYNGVAIVPPDSIDEIVATIEAL